MGQGLALAGVLNPLVVVHMWSFIPGGPAGAEPEDPPKEDAAFDDLFRAIPQSVAGASGQLGVLSVRVRSAQTAVDAGAPSNVGHEDMGMLLPLPPWVSGHA